MAERRKDSKNRVLKEGESERNNGTYAYRWRDRQGKRHSIYAKTLAELRDKENDVLKSILTGKEIADKSMTVNTLYDRWEQLKKGLRDTTFENYKYMYNQFVKNTFGMTRIQGIKKTDVRAFYNRLHDEHGLRLNTIDSINTVLHQVLEIGVEDGYLYYNPADNALKELKAVYSREEEKRKALTFSQQKILEEFLETSEQYHHWKPIVITMLYTGMRVGEVTGLRWCDVDFENNYISVNHTLVYYDHRIEGKSNCHFTINSTKTPASFRMIPMLPQVRDALFEERKRQQEMGIVSSAVIEGYKDFIFVNRFGNVQNQSTLNKAFRRVIRDCNYIQIDKKEETLPPFSCHTFRHTFATRLCEANINLKAIQDILGHSDISTTMNIYTDATKDLKAREAITLNDYFESLKSNQ